MIMSFEICSGSEICACREMRNGAETTSICHDLKALLTDPFRTFASADPPPKNARRYSAMRRLPLL
jgi:hypothetical protein